MRAIIIGAGRGQRLMPTTADAPKCFAEVQGKRILDWVLDAFAANGIDDVCFVGGYRIATVRAAYPSLTLRHNTEWQSNNILSSLMYAEDRMDGAVHLQLRGYPLYAARSREAAGKRGRHLTGRRHRLAVPVPASHRASAGTTPRR